ncbi:spore coat protein [Tepidibacter hydrothermalis]|uniref:Spore coat protein n=1 Tax=Tepidibacter hydrothermalis TaxID=3036126 RepID=A0ABY8EGW3_9FIRM|nr:spore coat protein [Tepidibacter hydrothermalis]WFD12182.1 spore coat protein [Tepidibacter hydrothermalis]
MLNLTQKERMLLEDQKSHEQMCIENYTEYAQRAKCSELKQLFNEYATTEQQHLDSINQILSGTVPSTGGGAQQQNQTPTFTPSNTYDPQDALLCKDALMAEKYVSGAYNTTIFECCDTNVRQVLNHIQKEEQEHGEGLFNYMKSKGIYNPQ